MRTCHCVASLLAIAALVIAVPASAQPGMTTPTSPPVGPGPTPSTCSTCADPTERQGPFVSVGLGAIPQRVFVGDVQLGWMIAPWLGVFVSLDSAVAQDAGELLWGAGLRLARGVAFAEAQILSVAECYEGGCDDTRIAMIGAGVELARSQHVALDLHLHVLTDGRDAVPLAGLGLGFYF